MLTEDEKANSKPRVRMNAIMRNIIRNKGTFVPKQDVLTLPVRAV